MPELPEVETVARSLRPHLIGRRITSTFTSGLALRRPIDAPALAQVCVGARIDAVRRIAKYLIFDLVAEGNHAPAGTHALLSHLGMSGRYAVADATSPRRPHTHFALGLADGRELRYVDPRRFGMLRVYRQGELAAAEELAGLGPDPLVDGFTVDVLRGALRATRGVALKSFLLDQRRVAGLGNIYASEALFRAGLSPRRRADQTGAVRAARLHAAIRSVLNESIARHGTTLRDYRDADDESGENQHS